MQNVQNEANAALQNAALQRDTLIQEAKQAIHSQETLAQQAIQSQKQELTQEATSWARDQVAMHSGAVVHEAEEAIYQEKYKIQSLESEGQQFVGELLESEECNLMQRDHEIYCLRMQLQQPPEMHIWLAVCISGQ